MTLARFSYRALQFWKFLGFRPSRHQLNLASQWLSPAQMDLFERMQPGEQVHSLEVTARLLAQGESDPDLLVAALLHDVGKSRLPLHVLDRTWIVLLKAAAPRLAQRWGNAPLGSGLPRWKRTLVVAEQHPQWGAAMAEAAGATPLAVALIRRHQETGIPLMGDDENTLLQKLQEVDDQS